MKRKIKLVIDEPEHGDATRGQLISKYGRAGSVWMEVLGKLGLDWEDFGYESVVKCQTKFSSIGVKDMMNECSGRHGGVGGEKVLYLAMGKDVWEWLGRTKVMKKQQGIDYVHGFVHRVKGVGNVMPINDLRMVKKGQFYLQHQIERDVEKAVRFASGEWNPFAEIGMKEFNVDAGEDEAEYLLEELERNPKKWLAYDIEGEGLEALDEDEKEMKDYEVYTIQFSVEKHKAFEFRVKDRPKLWKYVERILAGKNKKVGANVWLFDNPILESKGIRFGGEIIDTQWLFKHYYPGDVRKHLQTTASFAEYPFAWKHRVGEVDSIYPCADVDALRYVYPWLRDRCKSVVHPRSGWSLWDGYYRHYVKKWEVVKNMTKRGIEVDWERWKKLKRRLENVANSYDAKIISLVPPEVRKWKEYKTKPKKVREIERSVAAKFPSLSDGKRASKVRKRAKKFGHYWIGGKWKTVLPFKLSKDQVERYVEFRKSQCKTKTEQYKWRLLKNKKTGKTTTGKKSLDLLIDRVNDPMLNLVKEKRSLQSTIDNMMVNWEPGSDGCVHSTFDFKPVTGQMASYEPNVLNASNHSQMGQLFRWLIYVKNRDMRYVEFDMKSFHMAVMGFVAEDPLYYRFSQIDAHSLFWARVMYGYQVEWDKDDKYLKGLCKDWRKDKEFQKLRDGAAKPTTLGNQLGLGPDKLFEQNQPWVRSKMHAMELQIELDRMFPKVKRWKKEVRMRADRDKELMTWFGRIQRFYQVYKKEWIEPVPGRKVWGDVIGRERGKVLVRRFGFEHDKSPALEIQGNAFGYMDEKQLQMEEMGLNERFGFCNSIHDGFTFRNREVDRCLEEVGEVLKERSEVMVNDAFPEGFVVGVEAKVGMNWRKKGVGNPYGMAEVSL